MTENFNIRRVFKTDEPFVLSSMIRATVNRRHNEGDLVKYRDVAPGVQDMVRTADIYVACSPDDDDQIFGYLAHQGEVLIYVYVKFPFRRFGIARALFDHVRPLLGSPVVCVHDSNVFNKIKSKYNLVLQGEAK